MKRDRFSTAHLDRRLGALLAALQLSLVAAASCSGGGEPERPDSPPTIPIERVPVVEEVTGVGGGPVAVAPAAPRGETDPSEGAAAREPETHVAFDLIDNRHLAHRQLRGGLWIEAGSAGFPRYAHGNRRSDWDLNARHEGRTAALPRRRDPSLYLPLTAEQAAQARVVQLSLWQRSGDRSVELELEGQSLGEQPVEAGWQTLTFEVEPGALRPGENRLTLQLPSGGTRSGRRVGGALESVYLGPEPLPLDGVGAAPAAWARAGEMTERRLAFGAEQGAAWYVVLPQDANLHLDFDAVAPDDTCPLEIAIDDEAGSRWLYGVDLSQVEPSELTVALQGAPFDVVARLEMSLGAGCPALSLTAAEVRAPGPPAMLPADLPPPRNVVFWLVDALRADRLHAINPDTRVVAPAFDRMAAEGAVFRRAYVQGNESFASHASLFAGRYPEAIGVLSSRDHLDSDEELIAEVARRAGLYTGGYSSNGHIRSTNGFEQGFQFFINTLRDNYRYKAPGLLSHATNWVDEHGDEPFYLYIGTVDCHVTYRSHEDILPLYDPEPYDGPFMRTVGGDELGRIKSGALRVTERDRVRVEAIYDDDVTFSDRHFGWFLDYLDERGLLDETLIVVTSDHGDEFWEHGSVGHGHNVHDELVHVPLLMRYPAAIPGGTRVDVGVDTVDILPTIADLLGVEPSLSAQGESLLPLVYGVGVDYPRPAFSQQYGRRHAMALHGWKIIWLGEGERRLYDLVADRTEQVDVASEHPYALRFLTDAMGLFMAYRDDWTKSTWGVASNLLPGFDPSAGP